MAIIIKFNSLGMSDFLSLDLLRIISLQGYKFLTFFWQSICEFHIYIRSLGLVCHLLMLHTLVYKSLNFLSVFFNCVEKS